MNQASSSHDSPGLPEMIPVELIRAECSGHMENAPPHPPPPVPIFLLLCVPLLVRSPNILGELHGELFCGKT